MRAEGIQDSKNALIVFLIYELYLGSVSCGRTLDIKGCVVCYDVLYCYFF